MPILDVVVRLYLPAERELAPLIAERSEVVCLALPAGHVGCRCQAAVKTCCDELQ